MLLQNIHIVQQGIAPQNRAKQNSFTRRFNHSKEKNKEVEVVVGQS